jgi:hypothetical protein
MEAYTHGVSMIMCNNSGIPMCFTVGGLRWISTWGLGKQSVDVATYPNCHILHVHEPNYFHHI